MAAKVVPAKVARVAIVETDVRGAIAHHARCLTGTCTWESGRRDARKDGSTDMRVLTAAKAHGAAHAAAQDELDAQL